jgi:hypothetical protein
MNSAKFAGGPVQTVRRKAVAEEANGYQDPLFALLAGSCTSHCCEETAIEANVALTKFSRDADCCKFHVFPQVPGRP